MSVHKEVLEQSGPKELFLMSKNKKQLTVKQAGTNLLTLISPLHSQRPSPAVLPFTATQENLIGRNICKKLMDLSISIMGRF